ncbi:unnamed protein product, partial [Heterotrigona itama]
IQLFSIVCRDPMDLAKKMYQIDARAKHCVLNNIEIHKATLKTSIEIREFPRRRGCKARTSRVVVPTILSAYLTVGWDFLKSFVLLGVEFSKFQKYPNDRRVWIKICGDIFEAVKYFSGTQFGRSYVKLRTNLPETTDNYARLQKVTKNCKNPRRNCEKVYKTMCTKLRRTTMRKNLKLHENSSLHIPSNKKKKLVSH